ncbi:redoxin domain-containing protein, partial [Sporichthya sp.]|uniref:redoxin domain-containing protein n=1 Tax=Sporichthya sp. TaxID=65475 RepID=UPI0017FDF3E1
AGTSAQAAGAGTQARNPVAAQGLPVPVPLRFTAAAVDGSTIDGAALAAQPTVAWFWTPWCTICRAEAPDVAAAAAKFGDQVNFVGIAGLGQVSAMQRFVSDTGVGGFAHAVDSDGSIWQGFGVIGQPSFAFVHPDGQIEVVPGSMSPGDLEKRIAGLLAS